MTGRHAARWLTVALLLGGASMPLDGADVVATRFRENPLITLRSSPIVGDNANGPTVIRVPSWVARPLGRYYMYFAHHSGTFIRLAYADSLHGPWKVHDGAVLPVDWTAFFRPQPDPVNSPPGVYTHLASPEIYVDESRQRLILWVHGSGPKGSAGLKTGPKRRAGCRRAGTHSSRRRPNRPTA